MSVRELLPGQPVTNDGRPGSFELIEIIQRLARKVQELEKRIEELE